MVGIMSDSHDNVAAVRKAVGIFAAAGCDLVVHAGDFVAPFAARELGALACPVKAVFGNCDGEKKGLKAALEGAGAIEAAPLRFEHAGLKFIVVHLSAAVRGHVRAGNADVLIYGHTHKADIRRENGVLIINPGETGGWVHGRSTVALLDPRSLSGEIVAL